MSKREVEYRPVAEFAGYWVGTDGTFWSTLTKEKLSGVGGRGFRWVVGTEFTEIVGHTDKDGYRIMPFYSNGKRYRRRAHRIVLETFVGPCPDGQIGCHNNDVPDDNRLSNLRWDTSKSNSEDMVRNGTSSTGVKNGQVKLVEADVHTIFDMRDKGHKLKEIEAVVGVRESTISRILNGHLWAHLNHKKEE